MTSVGVFSLVYAPFFSVFLAHGVGVSQDAKSDLDFSNQSIHEFNFEKQAHVGEAKRVYNFFFLRASPLRSPV